MIVSIIIVLKQSIVIKLIAYMKLAFNLLLSIVVSKNIEYRPEHDEAVKLTAQDQ